MSHMVLACKDSRLANYFQINSPVIYRAFRCRSRMIGSVSGRRQKIVETIDCNIPAFVVSRSSFSRMARCKTLGNSWSMHQVGRVYQHERAHMQAISSASAGCMTISSIDFVTRLILPPIQAPVRVCWRAVVRSKVGQLTQIPRSDGIIIVRGT